MLALAGCSNEDNPSAEDLGSQSSALHPRLLDTTHEVMTLEVEGITYDTFGTVVGIGDINNDNKTDIVTASGDYGT